MFSLKMPNRVEGVQHDDSEHLQVCSTLRCLTCLNVFGLVSLNVPCENKKNYKNFKSNIEKKLLLSDWWLTASLVLEVEGKFRCCRETIILSPMIPVRRRKQLE